MVGRVLRVSPPLVKAAQLGEVPEYGARVEVAVREVGQALADALVAVEGQGDQFQLAFALMEIIVNKVGRIEGLVRGSRATEVVGRFHAIHFFLGAMGLDEADTKVRKANKLNPDKAKLPLDGVSNRKVARLLGKDGLEERRLRLQGEDGPAFTRAEGRDTFDRMDRTAKFAVEMCGELLSVLEHFATGDTDTGVLKRLALVERWNTFAEENFFREGRNVLGMPFLCVYCGRPLVLFAPGRKKAAGLGITGPSGVVGVGGKPKLSSARTHAWCRDAKKRRNRRLKLKLTNQT